MRSEVRKPSAMRYSVLLPTRNGGHFLRNCIESVLSQDYGDFELVISDNANTDETPAIIAGFRDHPKVQTVRLDEPVSVTDNWNAAYAQSSGGYILMMGDDDYLLPDYFARMDALLERHTFPDCVLYNGYSFVAPGSVSDDPRSYYSPYHFAFAPDLQAEKELSRADQLAIIHDMFRWIPRIPLNMQTTLVARKAAERIEGGFFQPPFPDHYALNAMLVMGCRWLFSPERFVVVGVSTKSFGHYVYSGKQESGLKYLGIDQQFPGELPGSPLFSGKYVWLQRLLERFPSELANEKIDRPGYVRRQVYNWLLQKRFGRLGWSDLAKRFGLLSSTDWMGLGMTAFDKASWQKLAATLSRANSAQAQWSRLRPLDGVQDIAGFADWLAKN